MPGGRAEVGRRIVLAVAAEVEIRNRRIVRDWVKQRKVDIIGADGDVAVHSFDVRAGDAGPDGDFVEQRRRECAGKVHGKIPARLLVGATADELQRTAALESERAERSGLHVLIIDIAGKDALRWSDLIVHATNVFRAGMSGRERVLPVVGVVPGYIRRGVEIENLLNLIERRLLGPRELGRGDLVAGELRAGCRIKNLDWVAATVDALGEVALALERRRGTVLVEATRDELPVNIV